MEEYKDLEAVHDDLPGEDTSFDSLFRKYYAALCVFAHTYLEQQEEARDLVQDCFIRLWEKGKEEGFARYTAPYLYTTVRNRCIDTLRKRKKSPTTVLPEELPGADMTSEEITEITRTETMRRIYAAIDSLPARMQRVFRMYYFDGKKYSEIAAILGIHYDTVRQQKARALQLLQGMIGTEALMVLLITAGA